MKKMKKGGKRVFAVMLAMLILAVSSITNNMTVLASSKKPVKITLNCRQYSMSVGDTKKLKVKSVSPKNASKSVKWKSSNTKMATVSTSGKVKAKKSGTVTAISAGQTVITGKSGKKIVSVEITVKQADAPAPINPKTDNPTPSIVESGTWEGTTWTIDEKHHLVVKG